MGEVYIEATCSQCGTEFDEADDCKLCCVCDEEFCEDCQSIHAMEHIFEYGDVVMKPNEKKKK